jgi:uncharacterized protein (DUF58 family)
MKPSRLLLGLLGGLLAAAVLLGALPLRGIRPADHLMPLAWGLLLALLLIAAVDALWLRRQGSPRLERVLPGNLPLGRWSEVQLIAHHDFTQTREIEVFDHVPDGMAFDFLPQRITLHPGQQTQVSYRLKPLIRGHFHFARCELTLPSPLRLWQAKRLLPLAD